MGDGGKKSTPSLSNTLKASCLRFIFILLVKIGSWKGVSWNGRFFIVKYCAVEKTLVLRDGFFYIVWKVRLVSIGPIWTVILIIVDVDLDMRKNWWEKFVFMTNQRTLKVILHFLDCCSLFWFLTLPFFNFFSFAAFVILTYHPLLLPCHENNANHRIFMLIFWISNSMQLSAS